MRHPVICGPNLVVPPCMYRPAAQPSMSSRMYGGGGGAHGRAMAFGGGSTKPPMVDNYLDSHGLNSGLGNAGASKFPSVVESRPIQVMCMNGFNGLVMISFTRQVLPAFSKRDNLVMNRHGLGYYRVFGNR